MERDVSAPRGTARRLLTQARIAGRRSEQRLGFGNAEDALNALSSLASGAAEGGAGRLDSGTGSADRGWPGANPPRSSVRH
jgi:hypothetical protein